MNSQPGTMSKEQIIRRVMELHEKGLSLRGIAAIMESEGVAMNKDKAGRIIKMHTLKGNEAETGQDIGFKGLAQKERVLQRRLEKQRKKTEYEKRIADLTAELAMANYKTRRELFLDEKDARIR